MERANWQPGTLERYVHGRHSSWGGFCLYDRQQEMYQHVESHHINPWTPLSLDYLQSLVESEEWKRDDLIPVELQLPEGF